MPRREVLAWSYRELLANTAKLLQECIRAEAGAFMVYEACVIAGEIDWIWSPLGECVCVTCGVVAPWNGGNAAGPRKMNGGHYLSGRRPSLLLDERGIHPQCEMCNGTKPGQLSGNSAAYEIYMQHCYGQKVCDQFRNLKNNVSKKWDRDELYERRDQYRERTKKAKARMR